MSVLLILAGCGGGGETPEQAQIDLQISVWPAGRSGNQEKSTLLCSPAGGSHANPEEACRRLERMDKPFVRPNGNVVCTEIYGGPALAEIRGTFNGSQLDATFARTDGCQIAHWDRHQFLFPVQPAAPR